MNNLKLIIRKKNDNKEEIVKSTICQMCKHVKWKIIIIGWWADHAVISRAEIFSLSVAG
jgi:hypothetical protein